MAKITRHGGASDKTLPTPEVQLTEGEHVLSGEAVREHASTADEPLVTAEEPINTKFVAGPPVPVADEGGEESSPGSSSPAPTEAPPTSSEQSEKTHRSRARKTASRSKKAQTENSSVSGMAGGRETGTSADGAED